MKVKIINAWVSYAVSSADNEMVHSSLVIHHSMQDAIDYILTMVNKPTAIADLSRDYDGAELIGASVPCRDETLHACSIPVEHK